MCGIFGLIYTNNTLPQPEMLHPGLAMIDHRGPDAWDVRCEGPAVFGHKRLAIIDLSPTGHQPMVIDNGALMLSFNGEIYNYLELREELKALGHHFDGPSDSEVILRGFRQWGRAVVDHLRGMFAFAIWDREARSLFLARDRVGKKPLFYTYGPQGFAFASELKSLLTLPGVRREANLLALADFFQFQYVGASHSAFQGIERLRPAHTLVFDGAHRLEVRPYWQLSYRNQVAWTEAEAIARIREVVEEAVRIRLRADVEVGAFLSGGVDSTIIVGLAAQVKPNLRTFTVSFAEKEFDESAYAQQVADRYGTKHENIQVSSNAADVMPLLVWHYGEPFADPSAVPSFYVAHAAAREMKVALNGDGGDESFVGYFRYASAAKARYLTHVPHPIRAGVALLAKKFWGMRNGTGWPARLQKLDYDEARWYHEWMTGNSFVESNRLFSPEFAACIADSTATQAFLTLFRNAPAGTASERAMFTDLMTYLPDDLLVKMDIACMAFALEGRSPFLDHRVMELAASIPLQQKNRPQNPKYLLKKAFADLMPPGFYDRPKMGFTIPLEHWLRTDLKPLMQDVLLGARAKERGLFQHQYLSALVERHIRGTANHGFLLWKLIQLELWFQTWIDGDLPTRPALPAGLR